jgi:hypothetical protein
MNALRGSIAYLTAVYATDTQEWHMTAVAMSCVLMGLAKTTTNCALSSKQEFDAQMSSRVRGKNSRRT